MFICSSRVVRSVVGPPSARSSPRAHRSLSYYSLRLRSSCVGEGECGIPSLTEEERRYPQTIDYSACESSPDTTSSVLAEEPSPEDLQTTSESLSLDVVGRWTAQQVHDWAIHDVSLKPEHARKLFDNKVTGVNLLKATEETFRACAIPVGPAQTLFLALEKLKSAEAMSQDPMQLMWTALLNGDYDELDDGVIQLRGNLRWLTDDRGTLFVRDCTLGLFEIVQRLYLSQRNGERGIVITGNPGIGKSWFLSYCLFRFAPEKKTIFFESVKLRYGWLFRPDGSVMGVDLATAQPYPRAILDDPATIFLYDPYGGAPREPLRFNAFTIVTASPNNQHYKGFLKTVNAAKYYMPCWSWDEIRRVTPYQSTPFNDEAFVRERFEKFGGIIRYVFSTPPMWDNLLLQAIGTYRANDLQLMDGSPDILPSLSHKLFHYEVTNDFRLSHAIFASNYIAEAVFKRMFKFAKEELLRFLEYAAVVPSLGTLRGCLFENFVHTVLPTGGPFKVRRLPDGTEETLYLPVLREKRFSKLRDALTDNTYACPEDRTYLAFDSFATFGGDTIAFQITVADQHPLKLTGISNAFAEIKKRPLRVYFCLPPDRFPQWSKKQQIKLPSKDRSSKLPDVKRKEEEKEAEEKKMAEEGTEQYALYCALDNALPFVV